MTSPFDSAAFDKAVGPMAEPVSWVQDQPPHRRGSFGAVVIHGAPDSQNAGNPLGYDLADPWTVHVSNATALVADVRVGDRISRIGRGAETLTVQQIAHDDSGWLLVCTSNERSPL